MPLPEMREVNSYWKFCIKNRLVADKLQFSLVFSLSFSPDN